MVRVGSVGSVGSWFVWEEITKLMYLRHSSAGLPKNFLFNQSYPFLRRGNY
ncbi:hypothetical protein [Okeania sp. SIO3I5]|uniref:hypothetical protein n=1 Tax=Okeania sp. SIO3I5 TaxID=2607805 RepID=UPI0025D20381|nr:hypothetical protein [Okeania sp. SIO3I5]